jgi:hypothetical protein
MNSERWPRHLDAKIDIFNRELLDLKRKIRRDAA